MSADCDRPHRKQRANRQARVGILPNGNRRPIPPPVPPSLTGRWMRLRSSRRPAREIDMAEADCVEDAVVIEPGVHHGRADMGGEASVVIARDGSIVRIDVEQLADTIESLGKPQFRRKSYLEAQRIVDSSAEHDVAAGARSEPERPAQSPDRKTDHGGHGVSESPDPGIPPRKAQGLRRVFGWFLGR